MDEPTAATRRVSARRTIRQTFVLGGRATRTEVASYALAALIVTFGVSLVTGLTLPYKAHNLIGNLLALAIAVPVPALLARRLHDQDRSGRWVWLAVFGFAIWALRAAVAQGSGYDSRIALDKVIWPLDWLVILANISVVLLIVLPGTPGPNRYGPDPRQSG